MSRERMEEAMRELGVDNDPTLRLIVDGLYRSDCASKRFTDGLMAGYGRMHDKLGDPDHPLLCGERRRK